MQRHPVTVAGALLAVSLAVSARAQQPLSIEQLMVPGQQWQLGSSIDYLSARPTAGLEQRGDRFAAVLRYGAGARLELNARLSTERRRLRQVAGTRRSDSRGVALGANWLLKRESATPALLLEARTDVHRVRDGRSDWLPGARMIVTAYQSFDPLVLSMTASVDWRASYRADGRRWQPGISWSLSPQVNFAVNHQVTLVGGLVLVRSEPLRVDGAARGRSSDALALSAGVGLTPVPRHTLFLTGEYGSGSTGRLALQWLYTF